MYLKILRLTPPDVPLLTFRLLKWPEITRVVGAHAEVRLKAFQRHCSYERFKVQPAPQVEAMTGIKNTSSDCKNSPANLSVHVQNPRPAVLDKGRKLS